MYYNQTIIEGMKYYALRLKRWLWGLQMCVVYTLLFYD